jgi:hypothetical protein
MSEQRGCSTVFPPRLVSGLVAPAGIIRQRRSSFLKGIGSPNDSPYRSAALPVDDDEIDKAWATEISPQ